MRGNEWRNQESREGTEEQWEQGWTKGGDAVQVWRETRLGRSTATQEGNRRLETGSKTPQNPNIRRQNQQGHDTEKHRKRPISHHILNQILNK